MASQAPFDLEQLRSSTKALAERGALFGASSWRYMGWMGKLYQESRYVFRGKVSETRFKRSCLAEYAETLPTVSVDAAYYQYPTLKQLDEWFGETPESFLVSLKVTDEITLKRFPNLPRFGQRAGRLNPGFLDADLFRDRFLKPCEPWRSRVGVLIMEFSRFHKTEFERGRDFVVALDRFLERIPAGWRIGVELRNPGFLHPDYFAMLKRHQVAHVFNSWEAMPPVAEQANLPGALDTADFGVARLLLKPGRRYEEAVKMFSPYDRLREPCENARRGAIAIVCRKRASKPGSMTFIYAGNRLEGNSLETIQNIASEILESAEFKPSS
ncbi:MAG: DUF72 domain-containing protein [Verrucomicrobia bacterium]|nr:DUF72 domain-containing protein [Verrucomicrobiota bacterium]